MQAGLDYQFNCPGAEEVRIPPALRLEFELYIFINNLSSPRMRGSIVFQNAESSLFGNGIISDPGFDVFNS